MPRLGPLRYPNLVLLIAALFLLAGIEAILQVTRPDLHDPTYFQSEGTRTLTDYVEDPTLFWVHADNYLGYEGFIHNTLAEHRVYILGGSIANGLADPLSRPKSIIASFAIHWFIISAGSRLVNNRGT